VSMKEPPTSDDTTAVSPPPATPPRRGPGLRLIAAMGLLVVVAGVFAFVAHRYHSENNQLIRVTGIPASVSTPLANLMGLTPVPAKAAPNFRLTDQYGHTLSLRSFRGHAVVIEFMDTHCTDICPIVSQEFIDAYHDLGTSSSHVAFIAVNVNRYHAGVSDVAAFSKAHRLNSIPSWHFFTGSLADLRAVWKSYGIVVEAPSPTADVVHSSFIFFIGPNGTERYLANPSDYHSSKGVAYLPSGALTSWGHGIALAAASLSK